MTVKLTLPLPLSVNEIYKCKGGRKYKTPEARAYEWEVAALTVGCDMIDIDTPIVLHVDLYRPRNRGDIDNYLKLLFDSMQQRVYANDSQIIAMHIRLFTDPKRPRVEVTVKALAS